MGKILAGQHVADIVTHMAKTGVSQVIGLATNNVNKLQDNGNAIIALAQLGNTIDIAKRWKLSKQESILLDFLATNKSNILDSKKIEDMLADGIDKEKISALAELQGQKKMANHAMVTSIQSFL